MQPDNPLTRSDIKYELTVLTVSQYELECYVIETRPHRPILYVKNTLTNQYHELTTFFSVNWEIEDIREDLLPTINEILEQNWGEEIISGQLNVAIIEPEYSFLTRNNNLGEGKKEASENLDAHIKTLTFRTISEKWLDFLEAHKG